MRYKIHPLQPIYLILIAISLASCDTKPTPSPTSTPVPTPHAARPTPVARPVPAKTTPAPYDYDTTLKGGYHIRFKADDSLECLYLVKGDKETEISSCSIGLPYKNLGYKTADFTNYFVLAHSFGAGNPHYIDLIDKRTARNALDSSAAWIGADESREILVYYIDGAEDNRFFEYNVRTGAKRTHVLPKEIAGFHSGYDIHLDTITDSKLIIGYSIDGKNKKKTYSRVIHQ